MVQSNKSKSKEEDRLLNEVRKFPCLYDNGKASFRFLRLSINEDCKEQENGLGDEESTYLNY